MTDAQKTLIYVNDENMEEAKFMSRNFVNPGVKKRAYLNVLGAEIVKDYLASEGVDVVNLHNLHSVSRLLEKFDIADILLPNIHIDVRVVFDENQIFVPKSHFDREILPDVYAVVKFDEDFKTAEFLGYFQPSMVDKSKENRDYYFLTRKQLITPPTFVKYVKDYTGKAARYLTEEDIYRGRELSVALNDHDLSKFEEQELLELLLLSDTLRESVLEFDNFETLAHAASSEVIKTFDETDMAPAAAVATEGLTEDDIVEESEDLAETGDLEISEGLDVSEEESVESAEQDLEEPEEGLEEPDLLGDGMLDEPVESDEAEPELQPEEIVIENEIVEAPKIPDEPQVVHSVRIPDPVDEMSVDDILDKTIASIGVDEAPSDDKISAGGTLSDIGKAAIAGAGIAAAGAVAAGAAEVAQAAGTVSIANEVVKGVAEVADNVADVVPTGETANGDELLEKDFDMALDMDSIDKAASIASEVQTQEFEQETVDLQEMDVVKNEMYKEEDLDTLSDINDMEVTGDTKNQDEFIELHGISESAVVDLPMSDYVINEDGSSPLDAYAAPENADSTELVDMPLLSEEENSHDKEIADATDDLESVESVDEVSDATELEDSLSEVSEELQESDLPSDAEELISEDVVSELSEDLPVGDLVEDISAELPELGEAETLEEDTLPALDEVVGDIEDTLPALDEVAEDLEDTLTEPDEISEEVAETETVSEDAVSEDASETVDETSEAVDETTETTAETTAETTEEGSESFDEFNLEDFEELFVDDGSDAKDEGTLPSDEQESDEVQTEETSVAEKSDDVQDEEIADMVAAETAEESLAEDITSEEAADDLVITDSDGNSIDESSFEVSAGGDSADEISNTAGAVGSAMAEAMGMAGMGGMASAPAEVNFDNGGQDWDGDSEFIDMADIGRKMKEQAAAAKSEPKKEPTPSVSATENARAISSSQIAVGEIPIDINNTEENQVADNTPLGNLYNPDSKIPGQAMMNTPGTMSRGGGRSSGAPALVGVFGAVVVLLIVGVIGFFASKMLNAPKEAAPQPITDDNSPASFDNGVNNQNTLSVNKENVLNIGNDSNALASTASVSDARKNGKATSFVDVKRLTWEVPDYISYNDKFKMYFQSVGKSLKLALVSDLLLAKDYIYSPMVKVSVTFAKDGTFRSSQLLTSSGSTQIDSIVLQTVNQTLKGLKAPHSLRNDESTTAILKIYF